MSNLLYKDKTLIGLDIGSSDIKIMAINPDNWKVLGHGAIDVDSAKMKRSLDGDGEYFTLQLKRLLLEKVSGNLPSRQIAVSLPTARTYSRTFTIPKAASKNLQETVELEASQYIPMPLASLYLDYEVIKETKDEVHILASAAPQVIIDNIIGACRQSDLTVNLVEPGMNSIARILKATENGDLTTAIVDIGSKNADIAILEDGIIRVTGSTPVGGNDFTLAIAKKFNIELENAHQLKVLNGLNPGARQKKIADALEHGLKRILDEVRRVMRYHSERINGKKVEQLIIVGGGSNMPGIGEYFTNKLVLPARVASPWQLLDFDKLTQPAKQNKPRYITVAGVASVKQEEIFE